MSAMFTCRDGKDGEFSNQALAGRIWRHITSSSANQNVQSLYSPLEIILNAVIQDCLTWY